MNLISEFPIGMVVLASRLTCAPVLKTVTRLMVDLTDISSGTVFENKKKGRSNSVSREVVIFILSILWFEKTGQR